MLDYFADSGWMGLCIVMFAFVIYWQLIDILCLRVTSAAQVKQKLLRVQQLLKWVSTTPLLGLLGTVSGLMDSFMALSSHAGSGLTTGVAQALLTTELGLAIAIPAWVALLLQQRRLQLASLDVVLLPEAICADAA